MEACRWHHECIFEDCPAPAPPEPAEHTGTAQEIDLADGVPMFVRFNGKEFVMIEKEAFEKMRDDNV